MVTKAYAPASIGNVSVGFDILGAALKPISGAMLGDQVTVEDAEQYQMACDGCFPISSHRSGKNLVALCHDFFHSYRKRADPTNIAITFNQNLPIGSGLGSSASSVVAALDALNTHYDNPFDERLLLMMGELEEKSVAVFITITLPPHILAGLYL